jgi:hypothetical protein
MAELCVVWKEADRCLPAWLCHACFAVRCTKVERVCCAFVRVAYQCCIVDSCAASGVDGLWMEMMNVRFVSSGAL